MIAAQSGCGSKEEHGENKADPKARRTEELARREIRQPNKVRINRAADGFGKYANEAVSKQGSEMASVKSNPFKDAHREWWKQGPKKRGAPRPGGDQQQPRIDRRMPQRSHHQTVEQH